VFHLKFGVRVDNNGGDGKSLDTDSVVDSDNATLRHRAHNIAVVSCANSDSGVAVNPFLADRESNTVV